MERTSRILLFSSLLLIAHGLSTCAPSEEDCQRLCDWWKKSCTGESLDSCMNDCADSSQSDVDYAKQQCLDSSPSGCKGASCCLRFVYEEYYFQQNCL